MLDNYINHKFKKSINPLANILLKLNISANFITLLGFFFGFIAFLFVSFSFYYIGLIFILLNRFCDGLDGLIAQRTKGTNLGGYLDIILDFVFYVSIPLAIAISNINYALYTVFILFGFFLTGTSFLVVALFFEKLKIKNNFYDNKSFFYSLGLVEATETTIFFIIFLLFPSLYHITSIVLFILCMITFLIRFAYGYKILKNY